MTVSPAFAPAFRELRTQITDLVERDHAGVLSATLLALVGGEGSVTVRRTVVGLAIDVRGPEGEKTIYVTIGEPR